MYYVYAPHPTCSSERTFQSISLHLLPHLRHEEAFLILCCLLLSVTGELAHTPLGILLSPCSIYHKHTSITRVCCRVKLYMFLGMWTGLHGCMAKAVPTEPSPLPRCQHGGLRFQSSRPALAEGWAGTDTCIAKYRLPREMGEPGVCFLLVVLEGLLKQAAEVEVT